MALPYVSHARRNRLPAAHSFGQIVGIREDDVWQSQSPSSGALIRTSYCLLRHSTVYLCVAIAFQRRTHSDAPTSRRLKANARKLKSQSPSSGALIWTGCLVVAVHSGKRVAIAFHRRTHSDPARKHHASEVQVAIAFQRRTHSDVQPSGRNLGDRHVAIAFQRRTHSDSANCNPLTPRRLQGHLGRPCIPGPSRKPNKNEHSHNCHRFSGLRRVQTPLRKRKLRLDD